MPSRRIRQHVNPLRSTMFSIAVEPPAIPEGRPVEVELGSAEAVFLIERARERREGFFVGVEIRPGMVKRAVRNCRAAGLDNVVSVFANMRVDLPRILPAGRVARMFLNFPDPWFKARQKKRRVADSDLIDVLVPILAPGGEILVNTDIFPIALDAMAALEGDSRLANMEGPWRFVRESRFVARSRRERECETGGVKIWRLAYRVQGRGTDSETLPRRVVEPRA